MRALALALTFTVLGSGKHAMPDVAVPGLLTVRTVEPERVRLRGATFTMGSSPTEMVRAVMMCRREVFGLACDRIAPRFRAEGIAHRVTLSAFELDRFEVTVEKYKRCVDAGECRGAGFAAGDVRFDRPQYPVTHVRWDDATSYCRFVSGRLPTEAEWEYAARGETGREFPWGDVYNTHICNHGSLASDDTDGTDGYLGLAPVGSFPSGKTPEGIHDLAGNVGEWVADYYHEDENGFGYAAKAATNPAGSTTGAFRVVRGGSYGDAAPWMRSAARQALSYASGPHVGFRCAYDPR